MSLPRRYPEMLEELVRIGIDLAVDRDVATLAARIVEHARRFTNAETGLLFLREEDHLSLVVPAEAGDTEPISLSSQSPSSQSIVARVAATGEIVNIPDLRAQTPRQAFPLTRVSGRGGAPRSSSRSPSGRPR